MSGKDVNGWSRRDMLVAAGAGALALAGFAPRMAAATEADVEQAVLAKAGGKAPKEGKITLKVPEVAENGGSVPYTVSVESPMTDKDYVKAVYVYTEGNPTPGVATFNFTPRSGKAEVTGRMRLAQTQKVRAVAVMSDGSSFVARHEVKVTVGGCGG